MQPKVSISSIQQHPPPPPLPPRGRATCENILKLKVKSMTGASVVHSASSRRRSSGRRSHSSAC